MPVFVAAFLGGLINIAGTIAGQVLIAVGISVVTYSGVSSTLDWLRDQAVASLTGLPSEMIGMIAYMGVGQCISIISSALVVRQTLSGLTGGTIKRWVSK